jgi:hypothetical protein
MEREAIDRPGGVRGVAKKKRKEIFLMKTPSQTERVRAEAGWNQDQWVRGLTRVILASGVLIGLALTKGGVSGIGKGDV